MGLCMQLGATGGVWLSDPATQQQPHLLSRQTTKSDEDRKKTNAANTTSGDYCTNQVEVDPRRRIKCRAYMT